MRSAATPGIWTSHLGFQPVAERKADVLASADMPRRARSVDVSVCEEPVGLKVVARAQKKKKKQ